MIGFCCLYGKRDRLDRGECFYCSIGQGPPQMKDRIRLLVTKSAEHIEQARKFANEAFSLSDDLEAGCQADIKQLQAALDDAETSAKTVLENL